MDFWSPSLKESLSSTIKGPQRLWTLLMRPFQLPRLLCCDQWTSYNCCMWCLALVHQGLSHVLSQDFKSQGCVIWWFVTRYVDLWLYDDNMLWCNCLTCTKGQSLLLPRLPKKSSALQTLHIRFAGELWQSGKSSKERYNKYSARIYTPDIKEAWLT